MRGGPYVSPSVIQALEQSDQRSFDQRPLERSEYFRTGTDLPSSLVFGSATTYIARPLHTRLRVLDAEQASGRRSADPGSSRVHWS